MMKKLICALALAATPAFAEDITVQTYTGPVDVAMAPVSVAVYDVAALDTLDALGIKPTGVLSNVYVDYLDAAVEGATVVGSLFEPDFEALAALNPDLVIAGGRSSELVPDLAKIAPAIDMTIWGDTVGEGLARLETYGVLFGKESVADALRAAFDEKLAEATAAASESGTALILMTNGPKVSVYGAAGRFGWIHTAIGLPEAVNAVEDTTHGEAISFEFIRDANPDVLIVIDRLGAIGRDGEASAVTLDNALVHETTAWKNGKVVYLDPARIYIAGGGIQSMTYTLGELAAGL